MRELRRWLWLRLTPAGRDERAAAARYWRVMRAGRVDHLLAIYARAFLEAGGPPELLPQELAARRADLNTALIGERGPEAGL